MKKPVHGFWILFIFLFGLLAVQPPDISRAATPQDPPPGVDEAVEAAVMSAIQDNRLKVLGFSLYDVRIDHIDYSQDGSTALVWLALVEPETGEVIAAEPGLSIARNYQGDLTQAANWTVTVNSTPDFQVQVASLPPDLLSDDVRMRYLAPDVGLAVQPINSAISFSGYKLPWAKDLKKRLSGSLGHIYTYKSCENTCRYAFDFADGTMFPLLAAKGGTVKQFKWSCPNFGTSCTNYLILEDQSTTPVSYQVYYHMAYDTLPQRLRTVGARVLQGEYIGDVDDTGASSGHHLHYHVFVTPTIYWEWGYSVDIRFDDVPINGGRPRTCPEARDWPAEGGGECMIGADGQKYTADDNYFVSGNAGAYPPSGDISSPAAGFYFSESSFTVSGSTSDDQGVTKVQVLGYFNDAWNNLGNATLTGNTFTKVINVCQAKIPRGTIQLALQIFDREGNLASGYPGQRSGTIDYQCFTPPPPPACSPGENEVALYTNPDYLGACQKFAIESYNSTQLGNLGNETASAIQVGAKVRAILYDFTDDLGKAKVLSRIETIETSDPSLADNWIGDNHVSAIWVQPRALTAENNTDLQTFLSYPGNSDVSGSVKQPITDNDSLILSWEGGESANQFYSELKLGNLTVASLDWQYTYHWSIGNLPVGDYTWSVIARNSAYPAITNTSTINFSVVKGSLSSGAAVNLPVDEKFESGPAEWTGTGLWRRGPVEMGNRPSTNAWIFNDNSDYKDALLHLGDLTSPPITLGADGPYYLRFKTYSKVEDGNPYWDQRRVQLSVNNGLFYDVYQFMDDWAEGPVWLDSPAIKLVNIDGQPLSNAQVRVRFHFNTVDEDYNTEWGWMIDDVSINNAAPDLTCADQGNSPQQAQPFEVGTAFKGVICGQGDIDYYVFTGYAGQVIQVDLNANPDGLSTEQDPSVSLLDSYIFLLDSTGRNVLAENDDEIPNTSKKDSRLTYTLQRGGVYYIKVRAWDHPGVGGPQYYYSVQTWPFAGDGRKLYLPVLSR